MKKLLLFTTMLVLQINLHGQAVPNGTFENWNSISYDDPDGWNNGNLRDIQRMGVPSVTKVSGYSGFAIRIQTNITSGDTSDSYIINTNNPCSDPAQWTGGVPYSQQPTAITGYYRYSLLGNDTAIMLVIFRKNGVHIGDNFIMIRGTGNQPTFASFSFPVTCSGVPDSIIIAAAPSNKKDNNIATNGSFIEFDNLGFAGTTQAIPGGTFENWTTKSYDNASGWESWNNGVSKTTSSYGGNFAVRIETLNEMCGGSNANSSGITTGHMTENNGPAGGIPYTNTNDTLCGYYKYTAMGNDTAGIYVSLTKNGTPVGGNNKWLTATTNYTYFEMPFQAGITPDTIRIDIQSSEWPVTSANVGSILYIDNLYLKSSPLKIFENGNILFYGFPYPNPVKDILNIRFDNAITSIMDMQLYDMTGRGREIESVNYDRHLTSMTLDVAKLAPGIYFYEIRIPEGIIRSKFVKE